MMSSFHKSLTISFLAVSIFISGLNADLVSAQNSAPEPMVTLTPAEQAWLAEHPDIVLGASTSYPPFVIKKNDGTHVGVMVDYLEEVSQLLNHRIRLHIEDPWAKVQEKGDIEELTAIAEALKTSSDAYAPFSEKLVELAEDFDFEVIGELVSELEPSANTESEKI